MCDHIAQELPRFNTKRILGGVELQLITSLDIKNISEVINTISSYLAINYHIIDINLDVFP